LGIEYFLKEVSFKPYASCRWSHSSIDAAKAIREKYGDLTKQINSINIITFEEAKKSLAENKPQNIIDAQFSLPYLISLELHNKTAAKGLVESDLDDENVIYLASLINLTVDETFNHKFVTQGKMESKVEITLNNGKIISQYIDYPKGDPKNPVTKKDIEQKFVNLASSKFTKSLSEQVFYN